MARFRSGYAKVVQPERYLVSATSASRNRSSSASFGSYQQKDLDKEITWILDETIELEMVAAIGASALILTIGELNTYIIA